MEFLSIIEAGRWRPGIGDPTWWGWMTVAAYLLGVILGCRVLLHYFKTRAGMRRQIFWLGLCLILLFLGINKQLDLQSWLTVSLKSLAKEQGWYESRRTVQFVFIVAILFGGMASLALVAWGMKGLWKQEWTAFAGLAFLVSFVVIRAASFHHVDQLLGWSLYGLRLNVFLEIGGILLIMVAAWRHLPKSNLAFSSPRQVRSQASVR